MIWRCSACGHYTHPPLPVCERCYSRSAAPTRVSGNGTLYTFTVNHQSWFPGNETPFVFAAVELDEQPGLFVLTNIVGTPADQLAIGMRVRVLFEHHEDVWLPLFELAALP
jgi:uncharacterized OB-fold protein